VKTLSKLGKEGNLGSLKKDTYSKLRQKRLNAFSLRLGKKAGIFIVSTLDILQQDNRNKGHITSKEKLKRFLFAKDKTVYRENPKKTIYYKDLLEYVSLTCSQDNKSTHKNQ
jgi:hypothetical protein